jgi:futalosine hydrolase
MPPHILITAAVNQEIENLSRITEKVNAAYIGGRKIYQGYIEKHQVRILVTGPGPINAVQAMTACIENSKPILIIQTGSAGAFQESGLQIGDIGIATEEIDIHLGIEPEKSSTPLEELPFPVLKKKGIALKNRYPCHKSLADIACKKLTGILAKEKINVKKGPFVTVSTITATEKKAKRLYNQFSAYMEAMEGSGAAHLSIHYNIPFLEIRSASNWVGKREKEKWNLALAFKNSNKAVHAFVRSFEPNMLD